MTCHYHLVLVQCYDNWEQWAKKLYLIRNKVGRALAQILKVLKCVRFWHKHLLGIALTNCNNQRLQRGMRARAAVALGRAAVGRGTTRHGQRKAAFIKKDYHYYPIIRGTELL